MGQDNGQTARTVSTPPSLCRCLVLSCCWSWCKRQLSHSLKVKLLWRWNSECQILSLLSMRPHSLAQLLQTQPLITLSLWLSTEQSLPKPCLSSKISMSQAWELQVSGFHREWCDQEMLPVDWCVCPQLLHQQSRFRDFHFLHSWRS